MGYRFPDSIHEQKLIQKLRSEGVVNELNRSQYVVARISNPYKLNQTLTASTPPLLVGTFVTAKLKGKTLDNVFKVPRSALLQGSKVAVVDDMQRLLSKILARCTPRRINRVRQKEGHSRSDHGQHGRRWR